MSDLALTERILALSNALFMIPDLEYTGKELSSSYGHWHELKGHSEVDPSKCYVLPSLCSGGDYASTSLVEQSNYQAVLEMMPEGYEDGKEYICYTGGYGTYAIAIRFDAVTEEILETLEALEDYPLIDEDLHSRLEMEAQDESWSSWGRSDFKTALGKALWSAFDGSTASNQRENETDSDYSARLDETEDYLDSECGEMSDASLDGLFWKMAEYTNTDWINENGSECWIDIDRVVSDGLARRRNETEWSRKEYQEISSLIQASMSDRKYDLHIVRFVDPNQLSLPFTVAVA